MRAQPPVEGKAEGRVLRCVQEVAVELWRIAFCMGGCALVSRLLGKTAAVVLLACPALGPAAAQDVGDKLELCMSCHGETGKPQVQGIPALAGRPVHDLSAQLRLFRSGERQNPQMVMAKRLTDDEIEALAAYFAKQDPKSGT